MSKQKQNKPSVEEQQARVEREEAAEKGTEVKERKPKLTPEEKVARKAKRKAEKVAAKAARIMYPGLNMDAEGNATTKLKEWPADFDPKLHRGLRRKDFETEGPFLIRRAERLEDKAKKLREEAALLGTAKGKQQKQLKKLSKAALTFKDKFAELSADLSPDEIKAFKDMFAEAMAGKKDAS